MATVTKFIAAGDFHFGWENRGGKLVPVHNQHAIDAMWDFAVDYKPEAFFAMGDVLDNGVISHWNKNKRRSLETLRLHKDAAHARSNLIVPADSISSIKDKRILEGNHDAWLEDLIEENPGLEGMLKFQNLLDLPRDWKFLELGRTVALGKWTGIHGENLPNNKDKAARAVNDYESNIRFWHHHTYLADTKISPVDASETKTGIGIPGMCNRNPKYGENKPNKFCHGFCFGEVRANGNFSDFVMMISSDGFTWNGKQYGARPRKSISLPPQRKAA